MYKVGLYTLGCKVSQYETEAVGEAFAELGFEVCPFSEPCDVYVINTCTVTAESDRKSRQVIRRARKTASDAIIIVMGCYSQRSPREVAALDGVALVLGTENKLSAPVTALKLLEKRDNEDDIEKMISTTDLSCAEFEKMTVKHAPRTRAYVKIEDGCEAKCTYCAISGARGRVRSKARSDVISEVEALYRGGTKEIVLTGIETGSYGRDLSENYGLADLICELTERRSCERLRLGSLAPELVGREFVDKVRSSDILAPHFHLSLQSGSDRVLQGMKRRYNSRMAMDTVNYIKKNIKGAMFTTDLMVGFPGETEEDFLDTVRFVREAGFLDAHIFAYSKRDGTPAAEYDGQIPEDVKRERSERLIRIKNEVRDRILGETVSKSDQLSVICETRDKDGYYTAHSAEYIEVRFFSPRDDLSGSMINVRPVSHNNGVVLCEIV